MEYYVLPNCCIARNPRVASMAIAQAVMLTYYPMFCRNLHNPVDFYNIAPTTDTPTGTVLMLVRDPVDRFLSAVAGAEIDPQLAIDYLVGGKGLGVNEHFAEQSEFAATSVFKYPEQLPEFCKAAGLPFPLPLVNETVVSKASLTPAQLTAVQQYYAADTAVLASVATATVSVDNGTL